MAELSDYVPNRAGAAKGSKGVNVQRLQNYLMKFGYMESPKIAMFGIQKTKPIAQPAPESLGTFDDQTEQALVKFQKYHGLEPTGELDEATLALTQTARCGNIDTDPDIEEYVVQGNKWDTNNLRYGFENFTSDLSQSQIRAAFSTAFGYWSAVTPLTFTEVPNSEDPEIRIRFATGDHGDGSPFDGPGGTLAHQFYPPPNGGDIAGDGHFDDAETWSVNLPPSGTDLYTVAAHEIGHGLGLAHSTVRDALMYPYYGGPHRFLHQDDIDGIQTIYGAAQWYHNKTIERVYVSQHSQNCYAYIQDVGWRRIEPGSPDGVSNMFVTLCAARGHASTVNVYVKDNTIRYLYL